VGGCNSDGRSPAEAKESSNHAGSTLKPGNKAERGAPLDSLGGYELAVHLIDYAGMHTLTINGFPVDRLPVMGGTTDQIIAAKLNTGLVGEDNKASVRVEPYLTRSGGRLSIGTVEMKAWIQRDEENKWLAGTKITEAEVDSAYQRWKKKAMKQWEGYLKWEKRWLEKNPDSSSEITSKEGGALDSMQSWASKNPLTVSTTFDNEAGPDFSRVFEEAPKLEDTPATRKRLKDYAMQLRDLMARKDTSALFEEFRPAIESRYRTGTQLSRSAFMKANRQAVVVEEVVLDFTRSDLRVRQWCGGRVWHIWRKEATHRGLFQDSTGGGIGKIYVAVIDGELRVVRQG